MIGCYDGSISPNEDRGSTRPMRADDETLLDVGGLGRTGEEEAEAAADLTDSGIGGVHVGDDLIRFDDDE